MNFIISITISLILISSWTHIECMETNKIMIIDCLGNEFTLQKNAANLVMPQIMAVRQSSLSQDGDKIFLTIEHNFLTQNFIEKLAILITDPTKFTVNDENESKSLYLAANYLCSEHCVFKRLFYFIKQQHPAISLDQFDISTEQSYSLEELLDEPFFDTTKVVKKLLRMKSDIQFRYRDEDEIRKETNPEYIDNSELHLNLSACNISSLQGLEKLIENAKIDKQKVIYISLNNNMLQALDFDLLNATLPALCRIRAKHNALQEIISSKKYKNHAVTLNLKNSKFTNLPKIYGKFHIVKLRETPLCSRARYHSRTRNSVRNMALGCGLALAYSVFAWQAMEMVLNKYSTGSFINSDSILWRKIINKCLIMSFPSVLYGGNSNEWIPFSTKYIVTRKKRPNSEIIPEIAEDCMHISYDLVTWPFLAIKSYFENKP